MHLASAVSPTAFQAFVGCGRDILPSSARTGPSGLLTTYVEMILISRWGNVALCCL